MVDIDISTLEEPPRAGIQSSHAFVLDSCTYNSISYEEFFNNHMRKNVPCIIKNVGTDWDATDKWASNDTINFDYLTNQYGNLMVSVTDCKNIKFDNQPTSEMKFSDYINYWRSNERDKMLYLKDWHLWRCQPNDTFYTVPKFFGSDWLNEYAQDKQVDDFMFVYMGPSGSWTPLHSDVYNSYSWSVNVSGRKKWLLFPPGEEEKLTDTFKNVVVRFEPEKYKDKDVTYYEIIQGKGDAIFVPSGWYHQVDNELDTISINHNWVNGNNIVNVWKALTKSLRSIKKEIDDLKDLKEFPSLCQNMLKSLFGMDCDQFAHLITHIGEKRLAQIEFGSNISFNNFKLGKNHCLYDLKCIQKVMNLMTKHSTFKKREYTINEKFVVVQDSLTYVL